MGGMGVLEGLAVLVGVLAWLGALLLAWMLTLLLGLMLALLLALLLALMLTLLLALMLALLLALLLTLLLVLVWLMLLLRLSVLSHFHLILLPLLLILLLVLVHLLWSLTLLLTLTHRMLRSRPLLHHLLRAWLLHLLHNSTLSLTMWTPRTPNIHIPHLPLHLPHLHIRRPMTRRPLLNILDLRAVSVVGSAYFYRRLVRIGMRIVRIRPLVVLVV